MQRDTFTQIVSELLERNWFSEEYPNEQTFCSRSSCIHTKFEEGEFYAGLWLAMWCLRRHTFTFTFLSERIITLTFYDILAYHWSPCSLVIERAVSSLWGSSVQRQIGEEYRKTTWPPYRTPASPYCQEKLTNDDGDWVSSVIMNLEESPKNVIMHHSFYLFVS